MQIAKLWNLYITSIDEADVDNIGRQLWDIIVALRSSTSNSRLVSGSKTLHHVLPALMPPIDREYTFRFFTGQTLVMNGEKEPLLEWWPYLCEIGRRCAAQIRRAVGRPELMATSPSKSSTTPSSASGSNFASESRSTSTPPPPTDRTTGARRSQTREKANSRRSQDACVQSVGGGSADVP